MCNAPCLRVLPYLAVRGSTATCRVQKCQKLASKPLGTMLRPNLIAQSCHTRRTAHFDSQVSVKMWHKSRPHVASLKLPSNMPTFMRPSHCQLLLKLGNNVIGQSRVGHWQALRAEQRSLPPPIAPGYQSQARKPYRTLSACHCFLQEGVAIKVAEAVVTKSQFLSLFSAGGRRNQS